MGSIMNSKGKFWVDLESSILKFHCKITAQGFQPVSFLHYPPPLQFSFHRAHLFTRNGAANRGIPHNPGSAAVSRNTAKFICFSVKQ